MTSVIHSWNDFWKSETLFKPINWSKNMEIFLRESAEIFPFNHQDKVLDIGCGPGALEKKLSHRVAEIHALDISPAYIDEAQKMLAMSQNVHFHLLENGKMDFRFLKEMVFDKIICLSVIQYFENTQAVFDLINEVKKYTRPGSQFFIVDICPKENFLGNLKATLYKAWKEKYFWQQIGFLFRAFFSPYAKVRKQKGLLEFSLNELQTFAESIRQKWHCQVQILETTLTLSENRRHLLIQF